MAAQGSEPAFELVHEGVAGVFVDVNLVLDAELLEMAAETFGVRKENRVERTVLGDRWAEMLQARGLVWDRSVEGSADGEGLIGGSTSGSCRALE